MLTTGTAACGGELGERLLGAGAQPDHRHVAGEDARRVARGLAARELQLARPHDHRVAAELHDPRLERRARARRRLLEQQRDRAPGERVRPVRGAAFSSSARSSSASSSEGESSVPVEEVARRQARRVSSPPAAGPDLQPLPRAGRAGGRPPARGRARARARRLALGRGAAPGGPALVAGAARRACHASARMALTSRNWGYAVRRAIAARNPDLTASNGGGCNAILVRDGRIAEHRTRTLTRRPERRVMHGVRLEDGGWVVNLHASTHPPERRREDLVTAAATALEWAAGAPLVFGGDLNSTPPGAGGADPRRRPSRRPRLHRRQAGGRAGRAARRRPAVGSPPAARGASGDGRAGTPFRRPRSRRCAPHRGRSARAARPLARVLRQRRGALELGPRLRVAAQPRQQVAAHGRAAGDSPPGPARRRARRRARAPLPGPNAMPTATARLSSTTGDGASCASAVVEGDDPLPVGVLRPPARGRGRRRSRPAACTGRAAPPVATARSSAASPRPTSIQSQRARSWSSSSIGSPAGPVRARGARGLQLHQRDEPVDLRLVGQQRGEDAAEPQRLLEQLGPHPVVAGGRRVALVEDQVDRPRARRPAGRRSSSRLGHLERHARGRRACASRARSAGPPSPPGTR